MKRGIRSRRNVCGDVFVVLPCGARNGRDKVRGYLIFERGGNPRVIKNWGAAWALAALIGIVGFGVCLDFSAPYHHCNGTRDCGQTSKNDHQAADYMAPALALGQIVDTHNGAVSAIATIVIAAFTVVLAWRTGGLFKETAGLREAADKQRADTLELVAAAKDSADAAKRSAALSERALIDLERPVIAVDIIDPGLGISEADGRLTVELRPSSRISITNYGRTPAMLIEYSVRFDIVPKGQYGMPPAIDMAVPESVMQQPYGEFIAAGKPLEFNIAENISIFTASHVTRGTFSQGDKIFFLCYIKFEDIFFDTYKSGFCAIFDEKRREFIRIGGDEYNYCRKEPYKKSN
jgi:hypothetical protein